MMEEVYIMRVPISLPCVIPVRTSDGMAAINGEPIPIEQRPEPCCRDAWWTFELAPVCDMHLRQLLPVAGDSYDAFIAAFRRENEYHGPSETELLPWAEGHRYPREEAQMLGHAS